jgi:hypothetical protein
MGWNSWDCFATTVTEKQVREHADYMAAHLSKFGWQYIVVDIQWYEPGATGFAYREGAQLTLDKWGRLLPAPNRFPSSAGGAGFGPLAAYVHARGLKFGVHLMRGIPRLAVTKDLPILGTQHSAAQIADKKRVCQWNPDMFGVDMSRPGAQEYYDSVFELFASWGVDYVKLDDMSRPYHDNEPEIEAVRRAIDRTQRPMVLSFSPGETAISAAQHVKRHANLWRISDDFWDNWHALYEQFHRVSRWAPHVGPGHWPDADMLPLGVLDCGKRSSRFTPDEQRTAMTLWAIVRSPLMHGGDLTKTDAPTLSLLTNREVLEVNQRSSQNRELFSRDGTVAWLAAVPDSEDRYLALFNTKSRVDLSSERAAFSGVVTSKPGSSSTKGASLEIDVEVTGAKRVFLVADDGATNHAHWFAVWGNPRWVREDGTEVALAAGHWVEASAWWGDTPKAQSPKGTALSVAGQRMLGGFGAPTKSVIEFELPSGIQRFRATVGFDDSAPGPAGETLRFMVFTVMPSDEAKEAGLPVRVSKAELGFSDCRAVRLRDLWEHRDLGTFDGDFTQVIPWHGSGMYRLTPVR